jgi:phosphoribosylformimino-5-aminoimidazole carboxamide ribotide isomerase
MKIIPAIDLRGGNCVRLLRGDFARETRYSDPPLSVARRFAAYEVGDLHIVDLDGARTGTQQNADAVRAIARETSLDVQLGGGIRETDTLQRWFATGVHRCVVGSMAVNEPATVTRWLHDFGSDRIVLALDVRFGADGTPLLATEGWTRIAPVDLWSCLDIYSRAGLRHALCTDIERDGALAGPNVDLYRRIHERYPLLQIQASGGIRDVEDLKSLATAGVPAAIVGRALLDGRINSMDVSLFRQSA